MRTIVRLMRLVVKLFGLLGGKDFFAGARDHFFWTVVRRRNHSCAVLVLKVGQAALELLPSFEDKPG